MFGYIITTFAAIFWVFRVVITLIYTSESTFSIIPLNMTFEIVVLFITFACIILIAKRKMLGAVVYLIAHCAYFGVDAYQNLRTIIESTPTPAAYISLFISFIAVIIPVLAIMDIGLSSGKKGSGKNRKTDWFYGTTDYDRKFDDRADKNQYKF